ncbi:MAG: hypothetical protein KIT69_15160, partial [Propionibacteriaceae bacterium]|nr:hypothetical protein [Propionibacteriaceae bacterium]
ASILALAPNAARARRGFLTRVMRFGIPAAVVISVATFICYLLIRPLSGGQVTNQVSTALLITLLCGGAWVMITISRPYEWWKLLMIAGCIGATVAIFLVPLYIDIPVWHVEFNLLWWHGSRDFFGFQGTLQDVFYLDTGNPAMMSTGFWMGGIAIVLIEIVWWVAGHVTHGERRRLWAA